MREVLQTVHKIASIRDSVHLSKLIQDDWHWYNLVLKGGPAKGGRNLCSARPQLGG